MVTDSLKFLTKEMVSLLKDGKWHRFGEFIPIGNKIPPEIGQRAYLTSHKANGYTIQKTLESQAAGGRTILLRKRLRDMVMRRHVFVRGKKDDAEYRWNPASSRPKIFKGVPDMPLVPPPPPIRKFSIIELDELKGKIWLTGAEYFAPERRAFQEIRKPGRPKKKRGESVLPVLVNMANIRGKLTLTLVAKGDKVIVEDIV